MLVDGYGLIFRAYHALQTTMSTSSGEVTNAVYGFASMLLNVLNSQKPDYAIVALEGGRTFRHDAYEGYKATRAAFPEDLRSQVERIRQFIAALNVPIEQREGYEADDVIGSLSAHCSRDLGLRVLVITGDTDLLQLVDEHVEVVLPGVKPKRFEDLRRFDLDAVNERYGFGPEFVPDYKALVGDTSDNIPGIPGIGEKSAKALIAQYGSLEQILEHIDEVTPTRTKTALQAADVEQAKHSKHLATIVRDLAIPCDLEHSSIANYDRDRIVELFRELEFRTLLTRLPEANAVSAPPPVVERETSQKTIVRTREALDALVKRIGETKTYAIDVETTSTDPMQAVLVGIAIAVTPTESYYIPVGHATGEQLPLEDVQQALHPIVTDRSLEVLTHHGKYDLQVLNRHGFPLANSTFDTMIAAYLLGESKIGLKDLAFVKLGIEMTEISELIGTGKNQLTMDQVDSDLAGAYAAADVEMTFELARHFKPVLEAHGQTRLFNEIEMPLIPVLQEMEQAGIAIDKDYLQELAVEIKTQMQALEQKVYEVAGREVNINSTRQLATLLFEDLKLPAGRKTATGYSVDQNVLEGLRASHEVVAWILDVRSLGKLYSTYVDALPTQINPQTGRIHTNFNQTIAATGRLSSINPNLQNIPIRSELGRRVRRAFVADHRPEYRLFDDAVLVSVDYSQIDLRVMAHLSAEPFLLEAFRAGEDIHRATAALVYDIPPAEVTANQRRVAKTVNFGLLYGMQAYGLSRDTGLPRAEAQKFIDQYWARLPAVKSYFDEVLKFGATHGYVETLDGRRRLVPDLQSSNGARRAAAERIAINMPVQGTTADIMKIAMIQLRDRLHESKLRARLLLQVHDELVLEVDRPHLEDTARLVATTMRNAYELLVPLETEASYGENWDEMTDLPL
jgi:DNA polymerase I